jgi:hypothetical protein
MPDVTDVRDTAHASSQEARSTVAREASYQAKVWTELDTPELREWLRGIPASDLAVNPFPTRTDIPRGGVQLWCRCEMLVMEWMLHRPQEVVAHQLHHAMPRMLLRVSARGGNSGAKEFRQRCHRFLTGCYSDLWDCDLPPRTPPYVRGSEERKMDRATRLAKAGHLHRAVQVASSPPMPPLGPHLTGVLRGMCPVPGVESDPAPTMDGARCITVTAELVETIVSGLPRVASADIAGRRNEHYQTLLKHGFAAM